jgi:hypothetical protein
MKIYELNVFEYAWEFWVLPTFSSINIGVYNLLKCTNL